LTASNSDAILARLSRNTRRWFHRAIPGLVGAGKEFTVIALALANRLVLSTSKESKPGSTLSLVVENLLTANLTVATWPCK